MDRDKDCIRRDPNKTIYISKQARRVEERRSAESARKAAQEAALRAREEAEEQKRQHLIQLWEQQQRLVEQRRREREEFFRRVSDVVNGVLPCAQRMAEEEEWDKMNKWTKEKKTGISRGWQKGGREDRTW